MEARESKVLDRSALADLWKNTLSNIPTHYGRLIYLASLLESDTGRYRHHGLAAVFGRNESNAALRESHQTVFLEWLSMPLKDRHEDLIQYLATIPEAPDRVIKNWRKTRAYRNSVPLSASRMERELFLADLEALLTLPLNGVVSPLPGS